MWPQRSTGLMLKVLQSWLSISIASTLVCSYSRTSQLLSFLFIRGALSVEGVIISDQSAQLIWSFRRSVSRSTFLYLTGPDHLEDAPSSSLTRHRVPR